MTKPSIVQLHQLDLTGGSRLTANTVITIGNFDGLHLGHQSLIERVKARAKQTQAASCVMLFEPQPQEYFSPNDIGPRLLPLRDKIERLRQYGIDRVVCITFNKHFSQVSAEDFIKAFLVHQCHVKHIIVGDDFRFGYRRGGDFSLLQEMGKTLGFTVEHSDSVIYQGERVSSTQVRRALLAGDCEYASKLLGRPYQIQGKVMRGNRMGHQLGFPTANVLLHKRHCKMLPLSGVFVVTVLGAEDQPLPGAANMGYRPTIAGTSPVLEVHLLDYEGDLYGKRLSVDFLHKIRDEQRFDSLTALKTQIAADVSQAKHYFQL